VKTEQEERAKGKWDKWERRWEGDVGEEGRRGGRQGRCGVALNYSFKTGLSVSIVNRWERGRRGMP